MQTLLDSPYHPSPRNPHWLARRRNQLWVVFTGALLLALLFQGNRGLWGPEEGRLSNVALLMLEQGDWLTPHRHPEHLELSRPPLTYWAVATSVAIFGPEVGIAPPKRAGFCRHHRALFFVGATLNSQTRLATTDSVCDKFGAILCG
jgi:hypothetical protein